MSIPLARKAPTDCPALPVKLMVILPSSKVFLPNFFTINEDSVAPTVRSILVISSAITIFSLSKFPQSIHIYVQEIINQTLD